MIDDDDEWAVGTDTAARGES